MLVWFFTQEKDFSSAFIHARSLDVRLGEKGAGLMELGNTSASKWRFRCGWDCFEYVAGLRPKKSIFLYS